MIPKFFGANREREVRWLRAWLSNGAPACFLEGASGTGKSVIAAELKEFAIRGVQFQEGVIHTVTDKAAPSLREEVLDLGSTLARRGFPQIADALASGASVAAAVEQGLEQRVLLVLDEAQRFLDSNGRPQSELQAVLSRIRNRPELLGRLLLLSDRRVVRGRATEGFQVRTLESLEIDEGVLLLHDRLRNAGIALGIAAHQQKDVISALGGNPRAIEVLVGALHSATFEDIFGLDPGRWGLRERAMSPTFLRDLEHDLLERTLRSLDQGTQEGLQRLAVHRRPVERRALELVSQGDNVDAFRMALASRFLVTVTGSFYALNPVARMILMARLKENSSYQQKKAHSLAASYYLYRFTGGQSLETATQLGDSFAEVRYHLVNSGRASDLLPIRDRFADLLKVEITWTSPILKDPDEREERIGVLACLLEEPGDKPLEYHLARCLAARNASGDITQAAVHATRATGPGAPYESFVFAGQLLEQAGKRDEAVAVLTNGIATIRPWKNLFALYQACAEILERDGKPAEAVALLKEGISRIAPEQGLFALYQACMQILSKDNAREAIALGLAGFLRIGDRFNGHRLAEGAIYLSAGLGDADAVMRLADHPAVNPFQRALARVLGFQLKNDWEGAANAARIERTTSSSYLPLAGVEALSLLGLGRSDDLLLPPLRPEVGNPIEWLRAFLLLRHGAVADARTSLTTYLGRPPEPQELNEAFLLRLWDQQEAIPESDRLCYHFPVLPPAMTGLARPAWRHPGAPPVLPGALAIEFRSLDPAAQPRAAHVPDVYVSYAWGASTAEGKRRGAFVDLLCEVIEGKGHIVGRDKVRLSTGESVVRFSREIAESRRFIAVISNKYLEDSEPCMVHELFAAYADCGFSPEAFNKKVIAVVIDEGARETMKSDESRTALAERWKKKAKTLREALQRVDPQGVDAWSREKLRCMEAMVPHVNGMVSALKDALMKDRGYDAIVQNGFREILDRLDSPAHPAEPERGPAE